MGYYYEINKRIKYSHRLFMVTRFSGYIAQSVTDILAKKSGNGTKNKFFNNFFFNKL